MDENQLRELKKQAEKYMETLGIFPSRKKEKIQSEPAPRVAKVKIEQDSKPVKKEKLKQEQTKV